MKLRWWHVALGVMGAGLAALSWWAPPGLSGQTRGDRPAGANVPLAGRQASPEGRGAAGGGGGVSGPSVAPIEVQAADALVDLGVVVEARCATTLGRTTAPWDGLSELLPARWDGESLVVYRQDPGGHLVFDGGAGPVELRWGEDGCTLRPARRGTVSGRVQWADGAPAPGATVEVCGTAGQTDGQGRFSLSVVADGHAALDADEVSCPVRGARGAGVAPVQMAPLQPKGAQVLLVLDGERSPDDDRQAERLTEALTALRAGELDPGFDAAADQAETLRRAAERSELTPAIRQVLEDRADALEAGDWDNGAVQDEVERQIQGARRGGSGR